MTSPQRLLREYGLRAQKALGQNFLVHEDSAKKIVGWSGLQAGEWVLEIGPGLGALTQALTEAGGRVIAVEKDKGLFHFLRDTWQENPPWSQLLHADALKLDWSTLEVPAHEPLRVVSNLPYSVSTPILEKLLAARKRIRTMSLLVQKEVADRVAALPDTSNYGRLSIWIQTLCDVEKGPKISPGSFYPKPDVDSALLRLTPRTQPQVPEENLDEFLELVALLFQHRRKTIRNSLRDAKAKAWDVEAALNRAQLDLSRRPATLTIPELIRLHRTLSDQT